MTTPYKASTALEALVLNMAPRHHPCNHAPNNWDELRNWNRTRQPGDSMPVYSGGSDSTIYSHPRYNYAFRAWHDRIHLDLGLDFSKLDEIKVCNEHVRVARRHSVMLGLDETDYRALYADVAGQILYFYKHGVFVKDQALFVGACIEDGIFNTIDSEVRY